MSSAAVTPARRTALRAMVTAPVGVAPATELAYLLRFLAVIAVILAALSVHLWSATTARETALRLDHTRSELARAQTRQDRLLLERATLRDPRRVREVAAAEGLVAPVAVVTVGSAR